MTRKACSLVVRALLAVLGIAGAPAFAEEDATLGFERTPPRLSFTDGEVSYWRPGASDWSDASVNTALAAGDQLSTAPGANVELQVGTRGWLRSGELSELGLTALEPDFLQLKLTTGTAALDLRELVGGQSFEIDTPNAAFTIERPGFYRVEVAENTTTFTTRRGGRATIATEGGLPTAIEANEQLVVTGSDEPVLVSQGAPELDDWDRWNYSRSEQQENPESARYVPSGVYGTADLDTYGSWQRVPTYGAVWVPRVAVGWAPYSTGYWAPDPYYGWTWVDDAPWGWAPFHYGRWVYVGNYWAWSPGPRVVRAYYSPALVAFYGSSNFSIGVSFGGAPYAGWVALGWGEPVVPWWGPHGCRGGVHWAGWAGPRYVNNLQINNYTAVYAHNIHHYSHWDHKGAFVAVDGKRFGHGHVSDARVSRFDRSRMRPVGARELGVRHEGAMRVSADRRRDAPARDLRERRVVTRRDTLEPGMRDPTRGRTRASTREATRGRDVGARGSQARERSANETRLRQDREARARRDAPPPTRMARAEPSDRRRSVSERAPATRADQSSARDSRRSPSNGQASRRNEATAARERGRERATQAPRTPEARSRESRAPNTPRAVEDRSRRESASEQGTPSSPRESRASAPRSGNDMRAGSPRVGERGRREPPRVRESSAERAPRATRERERAPRPERFQPPARAERREPLRVREPPQQREQPQRREQPQDRGQSREMAPRPERAPAAREQQQPRDSGGGNGHRGGGGGDGWRSQRRQS